MTSVVTNIFVARFFECSMHASLAIYFISFLSVLFAKAARLRISKQKHTFQTFIDELIGRDAEPGERLRVVCYIAHHGDWETESYQIPSLNDILIASAVEITELGDIRNACIYKK